ncbi:hypothetical protein F4781DRAFT_388325 [Annulohypoxylon bovei var. microspora]|nr:hypothetical protein F4781DRAFT_388325 [Annulohypoxylon bovei var. microspora]
MPPAVVLDTLVLIVHMSVLGLGIYLAIWGWFHFNLETKPQPPPLNWEEEDFISQYFQETTITHHQRFRHTVDGGVVMLMDWYLK